MAGNTAQVPTRETSTVANVDVVSLQVSLPEMLDLALGTPEVGAVNFNILHNFLHVLLHQINLRTTKVEYRGESADRIKTMVTSSKPGPALHLQEYSITDDAGKVLQRIQEADSLKVDIIAESPELPVKDDIKITKGIKQEIGAEKDGVPQTVIFVEPIVDGSTPSALAFRQFERSMKELQNQFQALKEFSTTPEVMERLKGRITDPVTDVWQFININKRLDANEQGIDKLTTMIQDMMKGDTSVAATADISPFSARVDEMEIKVSKMEQKLAGLYTAVDLLEKNRPPTVGNHTDVAIGNQIDIETAETDQAAVSRYEKEETKGSPETVVTRAPADNNIAEIRRDVAALKTDVAQIQRELRDLNGRVTQNETLTKTIAEDLEMRGKPAITEVAGKKEKDKDTERDRDRDKDKDRDRVKGRDKDKDREKDEDKDSHRMDEMKANVERCLEVVDNMDAKYEKSLRDITQRVDILEKEVGQLLEKVDSAQTRTGGINDLVSKIQGIQTDMERLGQTADRLLDDKESRETHLNAMLEQIELLKTIKADREDLEDALADKADAQTLNRKVSHDQFDAACDDLARGLEEAVDKLSKQESIWQQALDEVQNEIASKVDKIEMPPLKDFINTRLKSLQERLKSVAEMRRENEAAGTKKLLRDVQCISCDKDVVMKTEEVVKFRIEPLPCTTSIKPYLTYELDQVRKQQKKLPHSRNMVQFEAAMQEEAKKVKETKEEIFASTPGRCIRDHLCNRYCGGSHTIVTPQQKVMRVGHFLTQWGPEVVQLTDGWIKGKDGKMYRGRPQLDVCGPTCWENQISEELQSPVCQERASSLSATSRKTSFQSKRNSAGSRKWVSKKRLKEPTTKETLTKPLQAPMQQITSLEDIDDRALVTPTGP